MRNCDDALSMLICNADPVAMAARYRQQWTHVKAPGERAHYAVRNEVHDDIRLKA